MKIEQAKQLIDQAPTQLIHALGRALAEPYKFLQFYCNLRHEQVCFVEIFH